MERREVGVIVVACIKISTCYLRIHDLTGREHCEKALCLGMNKEAKGSFFVDDFDASRRPDGDSLPGLVEGDTKIALSCSARQDDGDRLKALELSSGIPVL
jgi:hypothetical protein